MNTTIVESAPVSGGAQSSEESPSDGHPGRSPGAGPATSPDIGTSPGTATGGLFADIRLTFLRAGVPEFFRSILKVAGESGPENAAAPEDRRENEDEDEDEGSRDGGDWLSLFRDSVQEIVEHVRPDFMAAAAENAEKAKWNEKHIFGLPGFRCGINADGLNNVVVRNYKAAVKNMGRWHGSEGCKPSYDS